MLFPYLTICLLLLATTKYAKDISFLQSDAHRTYGRPPHVHSLSGRDPGLGRPKKGNSYCLPWEFGCGMGKDDCISLFKKMQCCPDEKTRCPRSQACVKKLADGEKKFECGKKGDRHDLEDWLPNLKTSSMGLKPTTTGLTTSASGTPGSISSLSLSLSVSVRIRIGQGEVQKVPSATLTRTIPGKLITTAPASSVNVTSKMSTQTMRDPDSLTLSSSMESATSLIASTTSTNNTGTSSSSPFATSVPALVNSGHRLAPPVIGVLGSLFRSAHALVRMSPVVGDCCGDIYCPAGEVCTRSTAGARCWPRDGNTDIQSTVSGSAPTVDKENSEDKVRIAIIPRAHNELRTEPNEAAGWKAGDVLPPARLPQQKSYPAIPIPQFPAIASSCHEPNRDCGSSGCYQPGLHTCCKKPGGGSLGEYGLCRADKGESCCGEMCCPKDHKCAAEGEYLCIPPGSTDNQSKRYLP